MTTTRRTVLARSAASVAAGIAAPTILAWPAGAAEFAYKYGTALPDGSLLCGASTENNGWRIHMEHTSDLGATWERTPPLNDGKELSLIQPTILQWPSGKTQILCRSKQGKIFASWMSDDWKSWGPIRPTMLPNPNSAMGKNSTSIRANTHDRS